MNGKNALLVNTLTTAALLVACAGWDRANAGFTVRTSNQVAVIAPETADDAVHSTSTSAVERPAASHHRQRHYDREPRHESRSYRDRRRWHGDRPFARKVRAGFRRLVFRRR